jgi:hypothetical protein
MVHTNRCMAPYSLCFHVFSYSTETIGNQYILYYISLFSKALLVAGVSKVAGNQRKPSETRIFPRPKD